MGNKIVITEKLIEKLIRHDGSRVRCNQMVEKRYDLIEISKVILTSRVHSNKMMDLLPHLRIWAKILLGCVHHRKPTNFADYINGDKQYVLYNIAYGKKSKNPLNYLLILKGHGEGNQRWKQEYEELDSP